MLQNLLSKISEIKNSPISIEIMNRYNDFKSFSSKTEEDWFSELCFCLTTANSSAETGIKIQKALGFEGFYYSPQQELAKKLKSLGYRFYNKRAEYICEARKHFGIKKQLSNFKSDREKRFYLVENVKGFSFKEASHFLRNTGHDNCAILDRHILRIMHENGFIPQVPKHLSPKKYLEYEKILDSVSEMAELNHSLLDLYLWFIRTGKVLK
jgi:N-glycosylase/DNA lyase